MTLPLTANQTPQTMTSSTPADDPPSPPKRSLQRYGSDEEVHNRTRRPRTLQRSYSESHRDSRKSNIRQVVEQTNNVIVDLGLDGTVKWVSPSWTRIMGSLSKEIIGSPIQNIIVNDKAVFDRAVASLRKDDSRSRIVKFMARLGPLSIYSSDVDDDEERQDGGDKSYKVPRDESGLTTQKSEDAGEPAIDSMGSYIHRVDDDNHRNNDNDKVSDGNRCMMQGQGIMVFDRNTGAESHVSYTPSPNTIDVPTDRTVDHVDASTV